MWPCDIRWGIPEITVVTGIHFYTKDQMTLYKKQQQQQQQQPT